MRPVYSILHCLWTVPKQAICKHGHCRFTNLLYYYCPRGWRKLLVSRQRYSSFDNNNYTAVPKVHTKGSPCTIFLLGFLLMFILFWIFIIFVVSKRDKSLEIKISHDNSKLPKIEERYLTDTGVPKLFHRLWKSNDLPKEWIDPHKHCLKINSEYKLILWTDEMIYNFIALKYPWFYPIFLNYPYHIMRVDVARYFILYHYGGVYLDIDVKCKVPLKDILSQMTSQETALIPMTDLHGVTNSFMVAKARTDFFKYITYELPLYFNGLFRIVRHTTIIFSTGPMFLSHCLETFTKPKDVHIISIADYDEKYFTHAKGGTWHSWDTEIVDIFHFHIVAVIMVVVAVIGIFLLVKYYANCTCCS